MPAAYDKYDYPSYWEGREYEHKSEEIALKAFLDKVPKIANILEIGCGYGRHTNTYVHRGKKIVLTDPCASLLAKARKRLANHNNITFTQLKLENLPKKFRKNSFDLIIMIRVMHHLENPKKTITSINHLLKPGGYLVIEFANKLHGKELVKNLLKGNLTFPLEIFPTDKRSVRNKKKGTLPFLNFHPDIIKEELTNQSFQIIETRSVSNIRSSFIKKNFPIELMLQTEKTFQKPLSKLNFGPSIFILAQKKPSA